MSNAQTQVADTGGGFLVGVQPAQPQNAADFQQPRPDQAVTQQQPLAQPPAAPQQQPQFLTMDQVNAMINAARQEEKEKLYGRIDELDTTLKSFKQKQDEADAEQQRKIQEAEDLKRSEDEENMSVRDLLLKRDVEYKEHLKGLENQIALRDAMIEKDRQLQEVTSYTTQRLREEAEHILPELVDFVNGSTPDEVEAQIEQLKIRSSEIVNNFQQAVQQQQQPFPQARAAAPTSPPIGPMETQTNFTSYTPDQIKSMTNQEWSVARKTMLPAANPYLQRR